MTDWDEFFDASIARRPTAASAPVAGVPSRLSIDLPPDSTTQEAWRRGVARLGGVRDRHVARVLATRVDDGVLHVEHEVDEGVLPLRSWIGGDGSVLPGQMVTLGVGLARGLAAMHLEGASRAGRLGIDDVIVSPDGSPQWRFDYAVPTGLLENAEDVAALAGMLRSLLADHAAPGPLTLALLRADDEDPRRRPTAAQFADSLVLSHPAQPLTRTDRAPESPSAEGTPAAPVIRRPRPAAPAVGPAPAAVHRRRRPSWRALAAAAVCSVAVLGVVKGAVEAQDPAAGAAVRAPIAGDVPTAALAETVDAVGDPSASAERVLDPAADVSRDPVVPSSAAAGRPLARDARSPDLPWNTVVGALDSARARAFARADPALLMSADAPGSPALASDTAVIASLRTAGLRAEGFSLAVVSVEEVSSGPESVLLKVVDRLSAYRLVAGGSRVVASRPARADAGWLVTVVRVAAGWRIRDVRPADESVA